MVVTFSEKSIKENYVAVSLEKSKKGNRLHGSFHLENNDFIMFKISCRPDLKNEYVLMFAGIFSQFLLLFRTIHK